jgi:hypothetical protein
MPELKELVNELTNLYQDKVDSKIRPRDLKDEYAFVWGKFVNLVPSHKFGEIYTKNKKKIYVALKKVQDWWEDELDRYEDLIMRGVERVIEGSKEDIAYADEEDERDPEDVGEDELDDEDVWQYWGQEWHHNIDGKHWLTKFADERSLDLQSVRYAGLEGAAESKLIDPFRDIGFNLIEQIKDTLFQVEEAVDKKHVIRWAFDAEEEPFEW